MTEIDHDTIMKERIIIHLRTTEVGEIINIVIGTNMKEGFIIHFRTMEIEKKF